MSAWKKILCPVDFSQPSRDALHGAARLARELGGELTILNVYQIPGYALPDGMVLGGPRAVQDLLDTVDRLLAEWKADVEAREAGVRVTTATALGEAADEVVRYAVENDADVIVMGTHGRTGVKHLLLGSVAERVIRRATCPVLTVRPVVSATAKAA